MLDKSARNAEIIKSAETLSTAELADKYGISQRQIQKILSGAGVSSPVHKHGGFGGEVLPHAFIYRIDYKILTYIGQTTNIENRKRTHLYDLKHKKHTCLCLQKIYDFDVSGAEAAVNSLRIVSEHEKIKRSELSKIERRTMCEFYHDGRKIINNDFVAGLVGDYIISELIK